MRSNPDPHALTVLSHNLLGCINAHICEMAVGRTSGKANFIFASDSEISHLSKSAAEGAEIDLVTIDDFVRARGLRVTGIKIDAEGTDIDVIEGAIATLEAQAPLILTEAKPESRLFGLVSPLGYKIFGFTKESRKHRSHRLDAITEEDTRPTKMLFLVPGRLQQKFESLLGSY
jgi:FkbM family methyltransferase